MDIVKNPQETETNTEAEAINRAIDSIFSILQEGKKQDFNEEKAEQLEDAKKEISRERYRRKKVDSSDDHSGGSPSIRLNLPRIEYSRESAFKLLSHKHMIERILGSLESEIMVVQPLVEGDFIRGSNRLTARLSLSRMPYIETKRERKIVNGLKADWANRRSAAGEQAEAIAKSAPKEILESEDFEVEVDSFLKTGIWREHEEAVDIERGTVESEDGATSAEDSSTPEEDTTTEQDSSAPDEDTTTEQDSSAPAEDTTTEQDSSTPEEDEEYFAPDEVEIEPHRIERTPLERARFENKKNLSTYYTEWTQAHRDLQMIRLAMDLCRPDTRAYVDQMIFKKGKATHLVDAEQGNMTFLQGRECNEEAIQAMLYVISLHDKADVLNTHPRPYRIETVRIKVDGEEKVVLLTFKVIKQIAAGEAVPYPYYPWYESLPVEGYGSEVEDKLVAEFLTVETGEAEWNKRSPDTRPLSAIHEYQRLSKEETLLDQSIKDLYVNSRGRNTLMQESADRLAMETCYTTSSEILIVGATELLRRVCSFEASVITRFEQEIESLPEKHKNVLRQLYMEGLNFRELMGADGKPMSKNSSSRWNKEGLQMIQERMQDVPLSIRGQG